MSFFFLSSFVVLVNPFLPRKENTYQEENESPPQVSNGWSAGIDPSCQWQEHPSFLFLRRLSKKKRKKKKKEKKKKRKIKIIKGPHKKKKKNKKKIKKKNKETKPPKLTKNLLRGRKETNRWLYLVNLDDVSSF